MLSSVFPGRVFAGIDKVAGSPVQPLVSRLRAVTLMATTRRTPRKSTRPIEERVDTAAEYIPPRPTLPKLRSAAAGCQACHLWRLGTQTVFGEGRTGARLMVVGEQPGDKEDIEGRPFVGPSGRLLDRAFEEAGIERDDIYVTNVVKHFKWERGGKSSRRIHKKPNDAEIRACRPWLDAEIEQVKPSVILCLGATAAQALLGKQFRVTRDRGKPVESSLAATMMATVHPSSVLRAPDAAARERAEREFIDAVKAAAAVLQRGAARSTRKRPTTSRTSKRAARTRA